MADVAFVLLASLLVVLATKQGLGIVAARAVKKFDIDTAFIESLRREQMTKPVPKSINLNDMAQRIAEREGGKTQVNIAQIKEVMRLMLAELAALSVDDLAQLIRSRRK